MATGTVADWITDLADYGLGDDIASDDLLSIINSVIQDVNSRQAWSFAEATASVSLAANTAQVTLPARFNKAKSFVIDSLSQILVPERRDTIVRKYVGSLTSTGVPYYYYFIGQSMFVYPTPQQTYTGTLDYTQDEVVVTSATNLSSLLMPLKHQDVYILGTVARLYLVDDDTQMYQMFRAQYEEKIVAMMDDLEMHQYDLPERMVDVWDDGNWFG